jgi:4-hydroxybenzoate polyprenyltransferase
MTTTLKDKLIDYGQLMRLHRPIGIFLLLWPTLWGLWFAAGGMPPLQILLVFVAGTVLMRSAGCAINDYADRGFDPHVGGTRDGAIASGRVAPDEAVRLFVAVSLIAFGLLTSLRNVPAMLLAVPAAALAASYPFAKRFLAAPQAVLGIAFSWGIPMAFAAVQRRVDWPLALLLMAANVAWVFAYDTFYAMVDRDDDLKVGVRSSAILLGRHDRWVTALLQAVALVLLLIAGWQRGPCYKAGLVVSASCALYEQWLIRERDPAACFRAFLHSNWFGAAVFAGLALDLA